MLLLFAGVLWVLKRQPSPAPSPTVVPVTTYRGLERDPRFSPDGKQIAFSWDEGTGRNFHIYIKLLGETNALRLTSGGSDRLPAWSPDGKRIAFLREGPNPGIYSVPALGGEERKLSDINVAAPSGPFASQLTWSLDRRWLLFSEG